MASRLTRWAVVSGLGLVAVFVATLPPGPSILYSTSNYAEDPGTAGAAGLYAANEGALFRARERLKLALRSQSLLRMAPTGAAPVVLRFVGDEAVLDPVMTAAAESAWRTLPRATDAPRTMLVETDRERMNRRWHEDGMAFCLAAFDSTKGPRLRTIRRSAGACALATQFGPPGAPMRSWLDSVGMVSFPGLVAPQGGRGVVYTLDSWGAMEGWRASGDLWSLSHELEACAGGRKDRCLEGLGFHQAGVRRIEPPWVQRGYRGRTALLPAALLADLGPVRFAQLWRGDAPVPVAYQRLTGRPFDQWAMAYVQDAVGRIEKENGLTALGWLGWFFWMGLVLFWFSVRVERRSAT